MYAHAATMHSSKCQESKWKTSDAVVKFHSQDFNYNLCNEAIWLMDSKVDYLKTCPAELYNSFQYAIL